jgi:hypothetical protein
MSGPFHAFNMWPMWPLLNTVQRGKVGAKLRAGGRARQDA